MESWQRRTLVRRGQRLEYFTIGYNSLEGRGASIGTRKNLQEDRTAKEEITREFPNLFAFLSAHPAVLPRSAETWARTLQVARNCQPILEDLRSRGLDLVRLDQNTPPETDRRPLYETVLKWLPNVEDPLTLTICLGRLTEPGARVLVKKNRELLLRLARDWNERLREDDREHTLSVLSQCVMKAVAERDLPEVLLWARDTRLPVEVRASYVLDLQRFARKPGLARDALLEFVNDLHVGRAAVWAIAGALKSDALPILQDLRRASQHDEVRETAAAVARKIEARSRRPDLPVANPSMLPQGYVSTSIEFDTDRVPQLLAVLEQELKGEFEPAIREQLALSASQLKSGHSRFHIVPFTAAGAVVNQLGFGLHAEDEDVIVIEIYFETTLRDSVDAALARFHDVA